MSNFECLLASLFGVFRHSDLRYKIEDGTIGFPKSESLDDDGPNVSYFILEYNAFPLKLLAYGALLKMWYGLEPEGV